MDTFSFYEQQATLQCVWQLFQAHPSKDEVEFIEQQTATWNILKNTQSLSFEEKEYIKQTCSGFLNKWIVCAIQMNPYQAFQIISQMPNIKVSIRPTTGIKPLYTTIATVTMNLIVSAAIVLLNPYVTVYISYKIPPFALSVHIPDVSTSIYVEVDSKVLLGLPSCDKAFVR